MPIYSLMITDNINSFKILTCTDNQLTIMDNHCQKMIYKQYRQIPAANETKIITWLQLSHPNLLAMYKIQRIADRSEGITLGLYYEHFGGSLKEFMSSQGFLYEEEEIVNTFHPILEAMEYLTLHKFEISHIQLKNIVVTQNQEIKFIDESILSPLQLPLKNIDNSKAYEDLAQIIYELLTQNCKQKNSKSWKSRLQIIRKNFSKDTESFFISILNKALINLNEIEKTKKISKKSKQNKIEGKENKIVQ